MTFNGFPSAGLDLLKRLPSFDRDLFLASRDEYLTGIVGPSKAFVDALGPQLRSMISPGITFGARTNQSIAPINNDRRFNPDVAAYRDHLLFRFWEGADRMSSPTLFVRVDPWRVGFAAGTRFAPQQLTRVRAAIDADGDRLEKAIHRLVRYRRAEVVGQALKRVPAPYGDDHPHADLLRRKGLQVRWTVDAGDAISRPGFVRVCRDQLVKAADIHHWLVLNTS